MERSGRAQISKFSGFGFGTAGMSFDKVKDAKHVPNNDSHFERVEVYPRKAICSQGFEARQWLFTFMAMLMYCI